MDHNALLYLIPYIASLVLSIAVSIYAWYHRNVAGARAYTWFALSQASWTLGYILELVAPGLSAKAFWDNTQFVGMMLAPTALLAFAIVYTGHRPVHPRRLWSILGTITAVLLIPVFADNLHHWVRPRAWLVDGDPFSALVYDFGPLAWATFLYSYGVYLAAVVLLVRHLWSIQPLYRAQIGTILVGTLIPVVGTVISTAGLTPVQYRDITPFTFAAGNLVIAWGLFRYRLFSIVPIARDRVIESMHDAVIVIDLQGQIADANQAALGLLSIHRNTPTEQIIGQPIDDVFAYWTALRDHIRGLSEQEIEPSAKVVHEQSHYDLNLSSLYARSGRLVGHLIIVHDTTEQARVRDELEQYRDQLETMVWERTEALTATNKQLRQEIAERIQAEQALSQYAERLSVLHEIDRDILAARSPSAIAQAAVDRVRQLVPCLRAGVLLFDLANDRALVLAADMEVETEPARGGRFPLASFSGEVEVLQTGQVAMVRDLPSRGQMWQDHYDAGIRAYVSVPLLVQGELIGSLNLGLPNAEPLPTEQTEALQQVADHLAIAIRQADLREQVEQHAFELEQRVTDRTRELSVLYEVASLASQPLDLETTLAQALNWTLGVIGSEMGVIHLLDDQGTSSPRGTAHPRTLRLQVQQGLLPGYVQKLDCLSVGEGLIGWVVEHDEPIIVPDITADPRTRDAFATEQLAYVGLPLRAGGRALGVLSVIQAAGQVPLSVEELSLLASVADQLGTIVEGLRLQEQAERAAVLEERGRLARELHDSVTQLLYGINLFSRAGRDAYSQGKVEEGSQHLARLGETASQAIKEMRLLLYELRPRALEQQGLVGALQHRLDAVEGRAGVTAQFLADMTQELPVEVEQELYHIAQEALNNALKHSAATSVKLQIQVNPDGWLLEVHDDGAGFDPQGIPGSGGMGVSGF